MFAANQKQWSYLKKLSETNKLPHALLVSGILAKEFAFQLFGENITKKTHPDFFLVEPQGKEIKIEQIRDCIWRLSLTPFVAPFKVAVIEQAHLMNAQAQSALLKTLEEPQGKALLFLITDYPEMLFPTILSRVQRIKFHRLIQKPEKEIMAEIAKIADSDLHWRFQYAEKIAKSPELKEILTAWLHYLRQDLFKNKKAIQRGLATHYLISKTNANPRLALEILMMELDK